MREATTEAEFIEDVIRPEEEPLVATDDSDVLVAVARFDKVEPIAAVLPAGSDNVSVLDQAIRRLLTDGTIEDLTEQWLEPRFSEDPDALPVILTS